PAIAVDVELTARGGLPHPVGRGGSRDHDHAACAGLKTKRGLESPRPIDVQPDAGDIVVELEIAEGGAIDAAEHDGRAWKEISAILDREPHLAAGERGVQVELDTDILVLQQRAELGPRVVAAEQREI